MIGFQKGITLGGRTSESAWKVMGGGVGGFVVSDILVSSPVQSGVGVWTLDFGVGLDFDWTSA